MKSFLEFASEYGEYIVLQRSKRGNYFRICNEEMAKEYIDMYGEDQEGSMFVCKMGKTVFQTKNWGG